MTLRLDKVEDAIRDIRDGRAVVVVDDEDRENEGDLIFAASKATPELVAFMIRYTSGVICVPMEGRDLDRLGIPMMTYRNRESMRTAYTVSVDARDRITTGISAPTGRARSKCWPTRRRSRSTWCSRGTSSRCAPGRAACWSGPGTPRRPSTWPGWPG